MTTPVQQVRRPYNGRAMSVQEHDEIVTTLATTIARQKDEIAALRLQLSKQKYILQPEDVISGDIGSFL